MNPRTPRPTFRVYCYSLCLLSCLVGLIQVSTIISSSHQYGARTSGEAQNITIGASYRSDTSSLLNEINQLFPQAPGEKIAARVLSDTADGKSASVVIMLKDQADVSAAYSVTDQDARGWYVYKTLTEHAAQSQIGLQNFLKSEGVAYQSFWVANMIVVTANRSLVDKLAARTDVARIDSNAPTR